MALHPEEILQIKYELNVPVTLIGAEPFITYLAVFDRAIQPYIIDPATTSTTVVGASALGAIVPITVAAIPVVAQTNLPAFLVGSNIVVDVGTNAESTQITAIVGLQVYCTLTNAHGTGGVAYPVIMAGGEAVVRSILARINSIEAQMQLVAPLTAGMSKVDEISIHPASKGVGRGSSRDKFESLVQQREQARDDLGEAVGFPNLRRIARSASFTSAAY